MQREPTGVSVSERPRAALPDTAETVSSTCRAIRARTWMSRVSTPALVVVDRITAAPPIPAAPRRHRPYIHGAVMRLRPWSILESHPRSADRRAFGGRLVGEPG